MAFVPPEVRSFKGFKGQPFADCTVETALLIDQYEVTRDDWLHYMADPPGGAEPYWSDDASGSEMAWPASWMTLVEAAELAGKRGMRLPTATEWIHIAVDSPILAFPFGPNAQGSWANTLSLGLGHPVPVGTFESGRSYGYGCYDLAGNVAEWVEGWVPGYEDPDELPGSACAMGGGFHDRLRRTFGEGKTVDYLAFNAVSLHPDHRAADVGVRCAAPARDYLWARAGDWGSGTEVRARVAAVSRGWVRLAGRDPVLRVLEDLAARPEAPAAIAWLLEGAR